MVRIFAAFLIWILVCILRRIYRFEIVNPNPLEELEKNESRQLFAVWHQNILCFLALNRHEPYATMASQSKDGEIIALAQKFLGNKVVRGSSSRGGAKAMKELAQILKRGTTGALTVDGPRGPAKIPKQGVFWIAKTAKATIIPVNFEPQSYRSLKSWDQFRLPRPFSTIKVSYEKPITVGPELSKEDFGPLTKELASRLK